MNTYLMFGVYSPEGLANASADRTEEARALIEKLGGKLKDVYGLLGEHELVLIVQFPGTAEVMKASMALTRQTGVRFSTVPALGMEEFDKLFSG